MKRLINNIWWILFFLLPIFIICSCSKEDKKIVAVSQCSMDEWRNQMNREMEREAFFHKNIEVEIHSSPDDTEQQIRDIQSFIDRKVDAIVVAPNESEPLRPVIEKAYDAGIPVVLIDRRINSDKYTAFVGGDNIDVGRKAGEYIRHELPKGGNIIEIEGLENSSSSQERKKGLHEVLDSCPDIHVVANFAAGWFREKAAEKMDSIGKEIADVPVDVVFAYNDRMAIGAHESLARAIKGGKISMKREPLYIGVDGLLDDTLGIGRVEDGTLAASFLYQTGGDKAIHIAACILDGKPYERENIFETCLINIGNVHLMHIQANHIEEQENKIEYLNDRLDAFFDRYNAQKIVMWTFVIIALMACVLLALIIRYTMTKHKLNEKLKKKNDLLKQQRDELAEQKEIAEQQRDQLEAERDKLIEAQLSTAEKKEIEQETEKIEAQGMDPGERKFLDRFRKVIEENLQNPDVTVDMLGSEMNLGRVQLYRKVKALTSKSPNELLRETRLARAKELIIQGELNVSEIAYDVGFSSPSYFAKCYKDLYGENPTDALKHR